MADAISTGIHDLLAVVPSITGQLSTFAGQPSIFQMDPVPETVYLPYIQILHNAFSRNFETKTTRGQIAERDIVCRAAKGTEIIDALAEAVYNTINRSDSLSISGYTVLLVMGYPPRASGDEGTDSLIIPVTMKVEQT